MASQPITTAQAQVTTATVEIRTLTVNGKRMSIAVYEQMPWRHLQQWFEAAPGSELGYRIRRQTGEVWGWVNRHEKGCEFRTGQHLHLVVADAGRLLRATVDHTPANEGMWPFWDGVYYRPGDHAVGRQDRYTEAWTPVEVAERLLNEWTEAYEGLAALPQLYIAT
jgi:hypothetical protein